MTIVRKFSNKPLHTQVADALRQDILASYHPGEKMEGEAKFARRLGVSPFTLRQAFAVLAYEGLIERRNGSGTYVAGDLERPYITVFTFFDPNAKATDFQTRIFWLCGSVLRERGYPVRLHVMTEGFQDEEWSPYCRGVAQGRICGALFISLRPGPMATALAEKAVPYVVTGEGFPYGVSLDDPAILREGTRHLLERGCRKIAVLGWNGSQTKDLCLQSLASFRALLDESGAAYHAEWLRNAVPPNVPGAGWEQFREIWAARDEKPDGLLVLDDVLFRDVMLGILDSHIQVPEQLQVVTHANKGSGFTYPFPVTTLEIDPDEYVEAMADLLIKLIKKEPMETRMKYIQPHLLLAGEREERLSKLNNRSET